MNFSKPPDLVFIKAETVEYNTLGIYIFGLGKGHFIKVGIEKSMGEIRRTLLHEILHFINNINSMPHNHHDSYWRLRLKEFEKHFPPIGK